MIDFSHLSPVVSLLMEDGTEIQFDLYRADGEVNPSPEECKRSLKGIKLSYAFCGEQDFGIKPLEEEFKVNKKGIVTKIPKDLKIDSNSYVKSIRYGKDSSLDPIISRITRDTGIIGYWDERNLLICASQNYDFIIDKIKKLFCPKHVKFSLQANTLGYDLLILAV